VGRWDRIADPADFDALAELEGLTNPRIRETRFHRERFLAATQQSAQQVTVRCYVTLIRCELDDIRGGYPELHDPDPNPDRYPMSASFARKLRDVSSNGIAYRSVRHEDGECAAVIRLEAVPL
jgi:hypothetical protein